MQLVYSKGPSNHWGVDQYAKKNGSRRSQSRLNQLLRDGELFPPIAVGRYNTLLPKKTPIIFNFGKPIPTKKYKGATDEDTLWKVRERVEDAVTQLMQEAIDYLEEKRADSAV